VASVGAYDLACVPFDPHRHRVQLFTGKGGVGKSSVVAAHALACADAGLRPLVIELGHRATMESIFGVRSIGYEPTDAGDGVWACNLALEDALIDYVREQVKVRAIARRVVMQPTLRRFFEAAPAVNEVVALRRIAKLADAGDFHPILVDLDATGHALMFLGLADVFEGLVGSGPLQAILDATTSLLRDEARTVLHLVTLPAELPARETRELYARLAAERRVGLGALVINRVPAQSFDDAELADVARFVAESSDRAGADGLADGFANGLANGLARDLALAEREVRQVRHAHDQIEALRRDVGLPTVILPERPALRREPRATLTQLGRELERQLRTDESERARNDTTKRDSDDATTRATNDVDVGAKEPRDG
jgi:anion-transporting  ArsA/GET3 family ATPase